MLMRNNFLSNGTSKAGRVWQLLMTMIFLFTLGIGQMWADEIFAYTLTGAGADGTTYTATGGSAKCLKAMASGGSNEITIGTQTFYKFNSSSAWQFTLASGNFAVGDVISFTCACGTSAKSGKGVKINNSISVTGNFPASTANTITYTVTASDGIAGDNKFSLYRNDSDIKFGTVSVTRSSGDTPVCPSGLTISSKNDQTAFTEGDKIELTAALEEGNGTITYQWYKGSVATGNAISGATAAKYEKSNCTTADAGNYFCVASKTSCSDAVNASAFAITVAADTKCFNMPEITSKPADLAHVTVTGGTLSDVSVNGKSVSMDNNGLKFGGNDSRLKVTLTGASIIAGTKITVAYKGASTDGSGIGIFNENCANQTLNATGLTNAGSVSHTFTAAEAANYADEFIINRNGTGKSICVNAITVEDCGPAVTKHTITLNYNDGVTPNGSLKVIDGNAATQPADPERGKYTFLGWNKGSSAYNWSAAVTEDFTLVAQWQDPWTISFDADGGSAVADITVKHNTKAEKPDDPTYASHDFEGWFIGDTDTPFDWDANVTDNYSLKAHWIAEVAKYDIEYYDGETKIGTEAQVRADQHPTAAGIETDKPLYSFVGWFLNSALTGDPVALNTVTPSEGLKLYGKWTKLYAATYDMEAYAASDGASKEGIEAALTAANYAYTNINGIDNGHTHNYTYDGLKYKTNDGDLSFNVVEGKVVEVKTGHLPSNDAVTMYINGVASETVFEGADEEQETHKTNYFYSAAEALYRLEVLASKGTCAVKKITIRDPYQVSFDANGGDIVAAQYATPSVTLPSATNGSQNFAGWYTSGDEYVGMNGDSYTPTAAITLVAHWEALSTVNTLSDLKVNGVTIDGFDPEIHTYYINLPYGTDLNNLPKITEATPTNANASVALWPVNGPEWTDNYGGCYRQSAEVTPQDPTAAHGYNDIRITIAPKDGVSLIKVATTGGTNKTVTGAYAGDGDVSLSSNTKMDNGKYIGFILDGTTLQAGDRINVHTTQAANTGGSHIIFYDNMTDKNELYDTEEIGGTGDNIFTINAAMVGSATAYVYRANNDAAHQWNGYVDYIEVTRAMDPVLTAITIDTRDGVIDPLDDKHFSVTIPYESDLAALTVVPTVIRNAAHATTPEAVVSNAGAWVIGDNTYRVMDKDGDYTDYTITLDRDVLKHTVSFNTHGGSAVASQEIVHGEYLAAAPAAPEKEDYIFQYWSLIDGGEEVDITTVQINEDKEFHAVWVSDGSIRLLDGSTVNHTNYITGVTADETVEFMGNEVHYAKFSGTCSGVSSVKDLTRVIAYNATTNKTKIRISAHNNSTSARNILVKGLVEGASEAVDLATIALGNKEDKVSEWIEFNNAANRTIYIMVSSSAGDVYFTQVKVIESGETEMKQVGEAGYSLNLNKGRFFGTASTDLAFEGMAARLSGDYTALNSGYAKLNATSMSFTVANPVLLKVTTNNNKTYYVTKGAAGTDNETAKAGVSEFNLTAGTWYITAGAAEVQFTNLAFEAPKCEKPVITTEPETNTNFGAGNLTATVVAAEPTEGTLSYQWYNADGDVEVEGATAATLTTTTEGTYYVIVTNKLAGYQDNSTKSAEATLGYRVMDDATLSALGYGDPATAIALEADKYEYRVDLAEGTTVVPALSATATMNPYPTVAITDATEFVNYEAISTVEVTSEDGTAHKTYTVHFYVDHEILALVDVTGNMKWDFSKTGIADQTAIAANTILANVDGAVNDPAIFESDNIMATGGKQAGTKLQASMIKFHTTVPGSVIVKFANTGNKSNYRYLVVNGVQSEAGSKNSTVVTYAEYVPAGDVVLTVTTADGGNMFNFTSVEFKLDNDLEPARTDDWLAPGEMGTICIPQGAVAVGADIYELVGSEPVYGKIVFETVKHMKPGKPYMFISKGDRIDLILTDEAAASEPDNSGAMKGTFVALNLTELDNVYYFAQHALWSCVDLTSLSVPANRAYVKLDEVEPIQAETPAPGRVRMSLGVNGAPAVTTGAENAQMDNAPVKMMINGQLFILRGEKMYDATGRLVK